MLDIDDFISRPKSMLIAPAGYGKTTTIAECLKKTEGRQLILTHTHAGVASIKEKLRRESISPTKYNVETISGYAQKYVLAFDTSGNIPDQGIARLYYPYLNDQANNFFEIDKVLDVVSNTYTGIFVDEYQDCLSSHHDLISKISTRLPCRLLGDPMQAIFGFAGPLVNMTDGDVMGDFLDDPFELEVPFRWRNGGSEQLGNALANIRQLLSDGNEIDLLDYEDVIDHVQVGDYPTYEELYRDDKDFRTTISALRKERSLLIVHPEPMLRTRPREEFIKYFGDSFDLVEAIDDPRFYAAAAQFDDTDISNVVARITSFSAESLMNLKGWKPSDEVQESAISEIKADVEALEGNFSYIDTASVLRKIRSLPGVRCMRTELYNSVCRSLETAGLEGVSVSEAMIMLRNYVRRSGRRVVGKCIGTTLLTKGLEFDTVAIINAHKFTCPKNLYVAMTRASKRLIVFSTQNRLNPH